jgi:hypothetical protein
MTELSSSNDTGTKQAIVEFVETVVRKLPPEERVAVFDNDGTLWSEKPMPIELGFILQRLAAMAEEDALLREKQPWKAAHVAFVARIVLLDHAAEPRVIVLARTGEG